MSSGLVPTVNVLGLSYADSSPAALKCFFHTQLTRGSTPMSVFTPNATIAAAAARDDALCSLLQRGELLLPDGRGVLLAARLAHTPLTTRLPGIEAGETVLSLCASLHLPVYFLGAAPGVARRAAERWKERLPTLPLAGWHHGYFSPEDNADILHDIRCAGARVVLVCLGFPAQEKWIAENAPSLPDVKLLMGLGGSFDVWAGDIRRAPRAWQRMGLEWLWRSMRKPARLRTLIPAIGYLRAAKRSARQKKPVKI
ncbi:MAG: WecB/TagA/CpsF family glycosyltransferase [Clostridia bacterium]|nr:WecB/TagA/CpsF family glycosyltransferase [Clostridia bacterium]